MSNTFVTAKMGAAEKGKLGGNTSLDAGDPEFIGGILVGKSLSENFSVDLEWMHSGKNTLTNSSGASDSKSWAIKSNTFTANFSANLLQDSMVKPYLRAGLGMSSNKSYNYTSKVGDAVYTYSGKTYNSFAWQAEAGVSFRTHKMFDTQLEYMFVDRGKFKTSPNYTDAVGEIETAPAIYGTSKEQVLTVGFKVNF